MGMRARQLELALSRVLGLKFCETPCCYSLLFIVFKKGWLPQVSGKVLLTLLAAKTFQAYSKYLGVMKPHQHVPLTVLAVLVYKSMVWSVLAFTFPQAQANETEIHLSPALVITDVRQEKKRSCWWLGNWERLVSIYLLRPYSYPYSGLTMSQAGTHDCYDHQLSLNITETEWRAAESDSLEMGVTTSTAVLRC